MTTSLPKLTLIAVITGAELGGMLGGTIASLVGVTEPAAAVYDVTGTAVGFAVSAAESGQSQSISASRKMLDAPA